MLTDKPNATKGVKKRQHRRAIGATSAKWADSQKMEAVQAYLLLGSATAVANTLKIPVNTINMWKATQWWKDVEKELRTEESMTISNSMKRLMDKSLLLVEDRLENGDWIYDAKQQKCVRKPVSLKDAHKVAMETLDKRVLLQTTESYTVAQEGIQEKLAKLAKSFEEFAAKPKEIVIEAALMEQLPPAEEE